MTERVVLAYSGGPDTSVAIGWIAEEAGAEAVAFCEDRNLPIATTRKSPSSIDQNVFGRAVETGFLEGIWNGPIEGIIEVYSLSSKIAAQRRPGA